jgi:hypothetical protein
MSSSPADNDTPGALRAPRRRSRDASVPITGNTLVTLDVSLNGKGGVAYSYWVVQSSAATWWRPWRTLTAAGGAWPT